MLFFRIMVRLYGKEAVRVNLNATDMAFRYAGSEATLVHKAIESCYFDLVNHVFIDEVGFKTDFYSDTAKQTLIHTLVKSQGRTQLDSVKKL